MSVKKKMEKLPDDILYIILCLLKDIPIFKCICHSLRLFCYNNIRPSDKVKFLRYVHSSRIINIYPSPSYDCIEFQIGSLEKPQIVHFNHQTQMTSITSRSILYCSIPDPSKLELLNMFDKANAVAAKELEYIPIVSDRWINAITRSMPEHISHQMPFSKKSTMKIQTDHLTKVFCGTKYGTFIQKGSINDIKINTRCVSILKANAMWKTSKHCSTLLMASYIYVVQKNSL